MSDKTGKILYDIAVEAAKRWNNGVMPESSVRESFLFNVLNHPESFGLEIKVEVKSVKPYLGSKLVEDQ